MTHELKTDNNSEWFIPKDSREILKQTFEGLANPVMVEVFTEPGKNDNYNEQGNQYI